MYPDSQMGGMASRSLRLLNCRTAPVIVENMADMAKARKATDMNLGRAIDPLAFETSGESRDTQAFQLRVRHVGSERLGLGRQMFRSKLTRVKTRTGAAYVMVNFGVGGFKVDSMRRCCRVNGVLESLW